MPEIIVDRPGHQLGSDWMTRPQPCANCEQSHHALIVWTGGVRLCVSCSQIRHRNIRIAASPASTGDSTQSAANAASDDRRSAQEQKTHNVPQTTDRKQGEE